MLLRFRIPLHCVELTLNDFTRPCILTSDNVKYFFFFNRFQSFTVIKRQIWEKSILQEKKVKKKPTTATKANTWPVHYISKLNNNFFEQAPWSSLTD